MAADRTTGIPDPFAAFRQFLDEGEREMNRVLADRSTSDESKASRAQSANTALDLQNEVLNMWGRYFESINLPSRSDVLGLGDRLSRVEEGIARIEDRIRGLEASGGAARTHAAASAEEKRPKRTRRPPGKSKSRAKEAKK